MASNYFSLKEGHGHFKQGYLNFENKKLHVRFTSLFELREISIDSRVDLNNLKEDTLNGNRRMKALHNYILNIALDICLKTFIRVKNEMDHIVGRISVNEIGPESCDVYLYLTKPDDMLPVIEIDVYLADTGLENNEIVIHIMGKLAEQEHDIPFADVSAKSILDDYQNLKQGRIVHTICQPDESSKVASRHIEVKYRMHDELYPEVDEFAHHDIDEGGIAKTLLPYIKSLHEIYSRIYTNKSSNIK